MVSLEIDYWRLFAAVSIALFIHAYMYIIFVERPKTFKSTSYSTYFEINEIMSRGRLRAIALVYALPVTLIVAILAFLAKSIFTTLRQAAVDYLPEYLKAKHIPDYIIKSLQTAIAQVPDQIDPILVVGLTLLFLFPHFKLATSLYRNRAIKTLEVEETIDSLALKAAKSLLKSKSYNDILEALKKQNHTKLPAPADLIVRSDEELLAYQLMFLAKDEAADIGTADSLQKILTKIDPNFRDNVPKLPALAFGTLVAGGVWYMVFCAIYVGAIPFLADAAHALHWSWPERGREIQLSISILQNVFMFSIPVLFGQYTISSRIARGVKRPRIISKFLVSALLPFGISIIVGIVFAVLIVQLKSGDAPVQLLNEPLYEDKINDRPLRIMSVAVWFYTLSASLVPVMVIFTWERLTMWCINSKNSYTVRNFIFIAMSAMGFLVSQYLYELRRGMEYYFFHQMFLGAFLAGILLLTFPAAQLNRRRLTRS